MKMIRLTIPGEIRSKKNSKQVFFKNGQTFVLPSKAYANWQKDSQALCYLQIDPRKFPLNEPVNVEAKIFYKGNQPDLSGAMESIGDCFEGLLWADDKLIVSWDGTRLIKDNSQPRLEIVVRW